MQNSMSVFIVMRLKVKVTHDFSPSSSTNSSDRPGAFIETYVVTKSNRLNNQFISKSQNRSKQKSDRRTNCDHYSSPTINIGIIAHHKASQNRRKELTVVINRRSKFRTAVTDGKDQLSLRHSGVSITAANAGTRSHLSYFAPTCSPRYSSSSSR